MPRLPIDYSKTIIYHFVCKDITIKNDYVGHTTDFTNRKRQHKSCTNNVGHKKYHMKIYQTIRDTGGWENWEMVPLEEFPCESNIQARIREQYWMNQLNPTMNRSRAYRTAEEKTLQKKEINLKTRDKQQEASNLKYKTDGLYRHRRYEIEHARYIKKKDEILLQQKEAYKQQKDELNKLRRNKPKEEKERILNHQRWYHRMKKPYESMLYQSFMQKLLK
jgi:hypothetical protein